MPNSISFDMGESLSCCAALSASVAGGVSIICDILTLECPIMNAKDVAFGAQARARSAWATSIRRTSNDGFVLRFILLISPCQGEGSWGGQGVLTYVCTPSRALSPDTAVVLLTDKAQFSLHSLFLVFDILGRIINEEHGGREHFILFGILPSCCLPQRLEALETE